MKKLKNGLRSIERKIENQEKEISKLEETLADPSALNDAKNADVFHQHADMQRKLEDYMQRWEKAGSEIDTLSQKLGS